MLAAAKDGRSSDAETIVQEMAMNGLQPGPRAYHGLICAYCKAQNPQGALSAVRRAAQEGMNFFDIASSQLTYIKHPSNSPDHKGHYWLSHQSSESWKAVE